jgi:hypothetical protein
MVKYEYAVGVLVALALGSSEAFSPARSVVAPLRLELRGLLRRDMSASTLYNPDDKNDIQTAFQTMSSECLDSLSGALSDDDDPYEVEIALKKQMVKARADRPTLGTYRVSFAMANPLGMTFCQMDPGLVFSDVDLDVDTLTSQAAPLSGANANLATIDLKTTQERLGPNFRGILVSSVVKEGRAWKAGIRPGDIVAATSATVGDVSVRGQFSLLSCIITHLNPFYMSSLTSYQLTWFNNRQCGRSHHWMGFGQPLRRERAFLELWISNFKE